MPDLISRKVGETAMVSRRSRASPSASAWLMSVRINSRTAVFWLARQKPMLAPTLPVPTIITLLLIVLIINHEGDKRKLYLHDFSFFGFEFGVDFIGEFFGQIVYFFFGAFCDVFREFGGFYFFSSIFADLADGYFGFFYFGGGGFYDFFTALFGERGDWDADEAAVIGRVEAEGGVGADGGGDGFDVGGVEWGDEEEGGVADGDVGNLV